MSEKQDPVIGCSVKVMRSYDYCHFEVCLSSDRTESSDDVDQLRKQAARLVDKAVRQYQIAKEMNWEAVNGSHRREKLRQEVQWFPPESDRTPEMKAKAKLLENADYWEDREERFYDYEDDWDYDYEYEEDWD